MELALPGRMAGEPMRAEQAVTEITGAVALGLQRTVEGMGLKAVPVLNTHPIQVGRPLDRAAAGAGRRRQVVIFSEAQEGFMEQVQVALHLDLPAVRERLGLKA